MKELNLETRIKLLLCKGRNIVYYRSIDRRERVTYMHILRGYRKEVLGVINELPEDNVMKLGLQEIVNVIDPKVSTDGCMGTIMNLSNVINKLLCVGA